ncbi:VanZ family protein [Winogradskyella bathintestinalis]|uniref:VanZ family protein n=1 Tax=Winogradskyella bathintestinalis TaxID=3035208 RepID=A0ABT7ZPY6_9FLAO|nr:VanZ family protein [Winogradskyella bathintestinalis]MDN3491084.1 VanZ family protein [Winogradskyella bathintestinalis]
MLLLVSIGYTLALIIASLISLSGVPSLGSSFDDKIYHVVAYFGLALLWVTYVKTFRIKRLIIITCFSAILLGFILELLQYLVNPRRTYDTYDLIANGIGAVFGTIIATQLNRYKLK